MFLSFKPLKRKKEVKLVQTSLSVLLETYSLSTRPQKVLTPKYLISMIISTSTLGKLILACSNNLTLATIIRLVELQIPAP
jgi:hypothetical protein